jgi:eukaryotic-like serine/threonine-protein kinase
MFPPEVLSDRYEVREELGRGGAGRVYRAYDQRLDRDVAVKILLDHTDASVARFRREAAVAARIRHRNVVTLHDAGIHQGYPYLVMTLVDGPSLATRVTDDGPLPADQVDRLARDLLAGLEATHRAGVLHRDLTPRNVLFDVDGTALLADFGVARSADDPTITGTQTIMGTRPFVAPERLRGLDATPASDLFAVGVTLRYAITGDYAREVADGHRLAPLVRACTAPDPMARPTDARAALDRLVALLRGEDHLPETAALTVLPARDAGGPTRDQDGPGDTLEAVADDPDATRVIGDATAAPPDGATTPDGDASPGATTSTTSGQDAHDVTRVLDPSEVGDELPSQADHPATIPVLGVDGAFRDGVPRPVAIGGVIVAIILAGLLASNAIEPDDDGVEPAGVTPTEPAEPDPDADPAPDFDPDDPAGSGRDLARWLRDG